MVPRNVWDTRLRAEFEPPATTTTHTDRKAVVMSLKEITLDGVAYVRADQVSVEASAKQIVVGQRGWVFVGDVSEDGDDLVIGNAQNIRIWGTERGLGQLVAGPTSETKYDPYGVVRLPKLSVVARINVNEGAWL